MDNKTFCDLFSRSKFLTLKELVATMKVATKTVFLHLKKVGALTSYNKNGMYYTLPSTPCFNENGVWSENGICFSSRGTLKNTFLHLITNSDKGMTSAEMTVVFLIPADGFINIYRHLPEIQRERINGRYVYFSSIKEIFLKQMEARIADEAQVIPAEIPISVRDEDGIAILVEKIKNPAKEPIDISKSLEKEHPALNEAAVTSFMERNSLEDASEFAHVKKLAELTKKCTEALLPESLFPNPPMITFDPRQEDSSLIGCPVEKTTFKVVHTLHMGAFNARNIIVTTDNGSMGSQELLRLVAPQCRNGYDIVDTVGRMMHHEHKQAPEIRLWLAENNVYISESEVEVLAKKYIVYLSIIHEQSSSKVVEMMNSNGGYMLHLDAMGAKGGERLITGIDSLTNLVLNNAKIGSENSEEIVPFLKVINKRYSAPICVVQDMGHGIMNAVKEVFPSTPIFICHFHFLRDIGKDLLKSNYDIIAKRLTHFGFLEKLRDVRTLLKISVEQNPDVIEILHGSIVENKKIENGGPKILLAMLYSLLEWLLSWKEDSAGYGFPFDRPKYDLAVRLSEAWVNLCDMPENIIAKDLALKKQVDRVKSIVGEIVSDKELQEAMASITPEIVVFDKLRDAMRIAPKTGGDGLNDNNDAVEIKTIESGVTKFLTEPEVVADFTTESRKKSFFHQLKKYWKQLFADPITVNMDGKKIIVTPQRTNNLMERFFRDFSRGIKRKSGCDNIARMITGMVSDTPLIKNFENAKYLEATLGSKSLPQMFSEIDPEHVIKKMKALNVNEEKIDAKIKKCIGSKFFTKSMSSIAKNLKSNQALGS